jgi:hypothetical protein
MGDSKDFQKDQKPQQDQPQIPAGGRKNTEEVGEPVQLDDKSQKQGQQDKPGMGQRDPDKAGQHQGGGQHQETNR